MHSSQTREPAEKDADFTKKVLTCTGGARAEIYPYGAHLVSWRAPSGRDWLFLSEQALFQKNKAIRGGVPVIFPQFNALGPGQRHGFARQLDWTVNRQSKQDIRLQLTNGLQTEQWPHRFLCELCCNVKGSQLQIEFSVSNTGDEALEFTCALHTYLKIEGLKRTQLSGLKNLQCWDNEGQDFRENRRTFADDTLHFQDAIDRVFFNLQSPLKLNTGNHTLQIDQTGFRDAVVWNPGCDAARSLDDLKNDEYDRMLCVEAAQIDVPVQLAPGQCWQGNQILEEID